MRIIIEIDNGGAAVTSSEPVDAQAAGSGPSPLAVATAPAELLRSAAAIGALDAGPAPTAPAGVGPPTFTDAPPTQAGPDPAAMDASAGPAPGSVFEPTPETISENGENGA